MAKEDKGPLCDLLRSKITCC